MAWHQWWLHCRRIYASLGLNDLIEYGHPQACGYRRLSPRVLGRNLQGYHIEVETNGCHIAGDMFMQFPLMTFIVFRFKFRWSLLSRVLLTICQYGFKKWFGVERATCHYLNLGWPSILTDIYFTRPRGLSTWNSADLSDIFMMTSSNGNIFRVTGPLCGEVTGPGEFPTQRPVTSSFDVFFDLRLDKRLSKQPRG